MGSQRGRRGSGTSTRGLEELLGREWEPESGHSGGGPQQQGKAGAAEVLPREQQDAYQHGELS